MTALLSPTLWRAIAVAAALAGLAWAYHLWANHQLETGRAEIRIEWQADKLARAEQNRLVLMARDKESGRLQTLADKERKALNEQNRSLDLELAESLQRLRNRPERPATSDPGVPTNTGPGGGGRGCTGADLYKPDSEFLTREAARNDKLRIALRACYSSYRAAQETVNTK
jgi:hypothetical protein